MQRERPRKFFLISLGLILGGVLAIGIPRVNAQESTPTPEPTEVPLVPTPTAPQEEAGIQELSPAQPSSPAGTNDIIVSAEPENEVRPVVAYETASDTFLVVWQDRGDFAPTDIHARYVSGGGTPIGSRFTIALDRPGPVQVRVKSGAGLFLVSWREGENQAAASLFAQRVAGSPSGTPLVGPPVQVHSPIENQFQAVFNPDRGEFLFLWLDPRNSILASFLRGEVFGRRVRPDGTVDPQEFNFTPVPANPSIAQILNAPAYQTDLDAAYNPDLGQYLITYGIYNCTNISCTIREEVRAQRIDGNSLSRLGGTILVTPSLVRIQWAARTLYDSRQARYVVVWNDNRAVENDFAIFGQQISATGSLVGPNQPIISEGGSQFWPEIAYLDEDPPLPRFFLVWEDEPVLFDHEVRGSYLSEGLARVGDALNLSSEPEADQRVPQVSTDSQTIPRILAVWQHTPPGQSADIHAQTYSMGPGCSPDSFEPDNTVLENPATLEIGQAQDHTLCPSGDEDWVRLDSSGQAEPRGNFLVETFDLQPDDLFPRADTELNLYNPVLDPIARNTDRGFGPTPGSGSIVRSSRTTWHPAEGELFLLQVMPQVPINDQGDTGYSIRFVDWRTTLVPVDQASWGPTMASVPIIMRDGDKLYAAQFFTFSQSELDALIDLDATLAWEFRRPEPSETGTGEEAGSNVDYLDYWQETNGACVGWYRTNLPNHHDQFTEEFNPVGSCPVDKTGPLNDEEFEIYVDNPSELVAGELYWILAEFHVHPEDLTDDYRFYITKVEFCQLFLGIDYICNVGSFLAGKGTANLSEGYLQPTP